MTKAQESSMGWNTLHALEKQATVVERSKRKNFMA